VRVQLRIEVATRIVEEQGADEIFGQPISLGHLRFAPALSHGRELFHFSEDDRYRFRERFADALIAPNHRKHAHVFRRGKLNVDERHLLLRAELRQRLTGSRIPIAPERLERLVGHGARQRERSRSFADPFTSHLLLALRPIIVLPQMMRKIVRPIPNYSRGDHAHDHGRFRRPSQRVASTDFSVGSSARSGARVVRL
jgi:hypothetical protein